MFIPYLLHREKDNKNPFDPLNGQFLKVGLQSLSSRPGGTARDRVEGFRSHSWPYLFRRSPLEERWAPWLLERDDPPPEDLALLGAGFELRDLEGALRVEGAGLLRLLERERDTELARGELLVLRLLVTRERFAGADVERCLLVVPL